MTESHPAHSPGGASRSDGGGAAVLGLGKWLCLAATPTFAILALLIGLPGGSPMDALCSSGSGSPLGGMVTMYLLMSVFHSPPWLKLISLRIVACRKTSRSASEAGRHPIQAARARLQSDSHTRSDY